MTKSFCVSRWLQTSVGQGTSMVLSQQLNSLKTGNIAVSAWADAAFHTSNSCLFLHEQGRGFWGGKKWMDVWRQTDTWRKLHHAMESWDTRMKGWHHMDRPGPGLLVSSIAEVINLWYPCRAEEAKTNRAQKEMAHPACLVGLSLGGWSAHSAKEGPPQSHEATHHRGELKVKSDKRIRQQTTEKEPGLCQIMAGFKRNEFFLPGG